MVSKNEQNLGSFLEGASVSFQWQARAGDTIKPMSYGSLYGVSKQAKADFYIPTADLYIEVKGQMTLHQVAKSLYLAQKSAHAYYLYQATEEDWDPTLGALIHISQPPPPSIQEAARKAYNRHIQQQELIQLARNPAPAASVNAATIARLRAYAGFFDDHLRNATGSGLLTLPRIIHQSRRPPEASDPGTASMHRTSLACGS